MLYIFNGSMCEVMLSLLTEQCKYSPDTQDAVEGANCLHSNSKLPLTAGHHLRPSALFYSVLTDGVMTVQGSVPQITSLQRPLPTDWETLTCLVLHFSS